MTNNRTNCWEYKNCGLEPGGKNSESRGICPAAIQTNFDMVNNGINGGRFCWFVEKTLCNNEQQGSFLEKFGHCVTCDFYLLIQKQQGRHLEVVRNDHRK
ncbi:MAG: two-CW domain-containing protein [Bacteroidota bacterium]